MLSQLQSAYPDAIHQCPYSVITLKNSFYLFVSNQLIILIIGIYDQQFDSRPCCSSGNVSCWLLSIQLNCLLWQNEMVIIIGLFTFFIR